MQSSNSSRDALTLAIHHLGKEDVSFPFTWILICWCTDFLSHSQATFKSPITVSNYFKVMKQWNIPFFGRHPAVCFANCCHFWLGHICVYSGHIPSNQKYLRFWWSTYATAKQFDCILRSLKWADRITSLAHHVWLQSHHMPRHVSLLTEQREKHGPIAVTLTVSLFFFVKRLGRWTGEACTIFTPPWN